MMIRNSIAVSNLSYTYKGSSTPSLQNVSVLIPKGARVVVVGGNGAGKSTLLSVMAGRKMIGKTTCLVLGREAFDDTSLQQDVSYMGDWWKGEFFMDVTVAECLSSHKKSERFYNLARFLDVSLDWRISSLSDGQRRRVQLLANLIEPKSVYLLDEVTTDLDVLAREKLTRLLKEETENRGATVVYATHIFDNIEGWPTHVLYLSKGKVGLFAPIGEIEEYQHILQTKCYTPLYALVKDWLKREEEGNN